MILDCEGCEGCEAKIEIDSHDPPPVLVLCAACDGDDAPEGWHPRPDADRGAR